MTENTLQYQEQRLADLEAQIRYKWSVVGPAIYEIQHLQTRVDEVKAAIRAEQAAAAAKAKTPETPPVEPPPVRKRDQMSRLKLYKEITLDTQVSPEGSFGNADATDSIDGVTGGTDTAELWAATEQTTLASAVDDSLGRLALTAARFAGSGYLVLRVENELMLITSGAGTTSPRVTRGYGDTTPAEHAAGTRVYAAYEYQRATIAAVETGDADVNFTVEYSLDNAAFSSSLALGYIPYTGSVKLYRRATITAGTPAELKTDIIHRLAAGINQVEVAA